MTADNRPDWRLSTVIEASAVAKGIQRVTFQRPPSARAQPGTHIDVRVQFGDSTDTRSYSVVESSDDGGLITVSVLLSPQSRGGSVFMHALRAGDTVMTTQPLQNFPLRIGAQQYVLLAGGIGITAIIGMARVLKALKADYTFVYAARSRESMAYLAELQDAHGDRLRVHVDDEGISLNVIELVSEIAANLNGGNAELYMCGPIRLMDAVRRHWAACELPVYNLRYETFGNSGWFEPEEFLVRIPRLNIEATVGTHTTILEALTAAGADMMFDCRKGECGLCEVIIQQLDGVIDHRDVFLSEKQHKAGKKLCTCVSRAVSYSAAQTRGIMPPPVSSAPVDPLADSGTKKGRPVLTIEIP
jgi:vanillate O-demethylase ferredoxin subunit